MLIKAHFLLIPDKGLQISFNDEDQPLATVTICSGESAGEMILGALAQDSKAIDGSVDAEHISEYSPPGDALTGLLLDVFIEAVKWRDANPGVQLEMNEED